MIDNFCSASFSSHTLERFSCPTDFGVRYAQRLRAAANVRVLLHANVTGLRLNPAGSAVDRLTVRTLAGRSFTVDAAQVVIATGGLEAARLLLANRDVHRNGIGNDHDVVGRYYMCQMTATLGSLTMAGPPGAVWHGYDIADDGAYCRRRLAVLPEAQRALRIGNISARLHHPRMDDPEHRSGILSLLHLARCLIPRDRAQRAHDGDGAELRLWTQHLRNVVGDSFSTLSLGWRLLCDRLLAERKLPSLIIAPANQCYRLDLHAEQQPNPSSRVTLDQERDALGQPRLRIDWRYLGADVGTVQRTLSLFAQEIERARVGRFRYDPETVEQELIRQGACSGHHIGTARMGSDPLSSVTNAHGRVHGVDNLFVAGAALFPTSSQAAPTLTIVALALRMAQHLRRRHAREALATQYTTRVLPDLQTRLEAAA